MVYQSMAMGCFPRFRVQHTSEEVGGQIFIPEVRLPVFRTAVHTELPFQTQAS
jgi:K+ transporter